MQADTEFALLSDIADFEMGQSPDSSFVNDAGIGTPFLQGNAEFGPVSPTHRLYCLRPKKLCRPGDVLISVRAPVGALNKADRVYCIGRGLAAVRFHNVLPDYGWHLLNYWAPNLRIVAQGTTFEAIGKAELLSLRVVRLPEPEQHRIADILDAADAAIQQTEALIAKLKQVKAGLLHDLLTRGLDAHGRLRDPAAHPEQFVESPVGRVPREWEACQISDLLYDVIDFRGKTPLKIGLEWGGGNIPALSANNVEMGRINLSKETYYGSDKLYRRWMTKGDCAKGDIIITMEAPLGNVAQIPDDRKYILSQRVLLLKTRSERVFNDFLKHELMSTGFQSQLAQNATGTTAKGIQQAKLMKLLVPLPPFSEQVTVAEALDAHDALIRAEEAYRDKLAQVKRGLMEDLLTGRVRVA